MLKQLYEIGKYLENKYPENFFPWENPFPKQDNAKVLVAKITNGTLENQLFLEDFRSIHFSKYLFRKVNGANGTNLVPTLRFAFSINEADFNKNLKTLIKKVKASIKNSDIKILNNKYLIENLEEIFINAKNNNIFSLDDKYIFTFKINEKYFGDFREYKDLFENEAYSKYYQKKSTNATSMANNKVCSLTYNIENEVWGFVDTLGFTVDSNTFMRNGFNRNNAYKMNPVSDNAVRILEGAKKTVMEKFSSVSYRLSDLQYFILPHIIKLKSEVEEEIYDLFLEKINLELKNDNNSIISNESILNEIIQDEKLSRNNIYYDIFFYQLNQSQFLIKLHLHDVMPSRLKKIFQAKYEIETFYKPITTIKSKKNKVWDFYINFKNIKEFFSDDKNIHPYFFNIIESVFYGKMIDEKEFIKTIVKKIVKDYKNINSEEYPFYNSVKHSFVIFQFLKYLSLFNSIKTNYMETEIQLTTEGFIDQHISLFDNDYKKGIFLLGVLTHKLTYEQEKNIGGKPFLKNLNNLSIDNKIIQRIFPKIINKLRQYDVNYTKDLEGQTALYLANNESLDKPTTSYIFTLGLVMGKEFDKSFFESRKQ
jgi:CRISPR-associated Csh1 family protein